jgi:hypothetical protein
MLTIRYRETGRTADVVMRLDKIEGLVLVGKGNVFYLDGVLENENAEWTIGANDFSEDWELVRASDEDRGRLLGAGFRV